MDTATRKRQAVIAEVESLIDLCALNMADEEKRWSARPCHQELRNIGDMIASAAHAKRGAAQQPAPAPSAPAVQGGDLYLYAWNAATRWLVSIVSHERDANGYVLVRTVATTSSDGGFFGMHLRPWRANPINLRLAEFPDDMIGYSWERPDAPSQPAPTGADRVSAAPVMANLDRAEKEPAAPAPTQSRVEVLDGLLSRAKEIDAELAAQEAASTQGAGGGCRFPLHVGSSWCANLPDHRHHVCVHGEAHPPRLDCHPYAAWNRHAPVAAQPSVNLNDTMDAHVWAKEFVRLNPVCGEGTMTGWFANAIMAGYDAAMRKQEAAQPEPPAAPPYAEGRPEPDVPRCHMPDRAHDELTRQELGREQGRIATLERENETLRSSCRRLNRRAQSAESNERKQFSYELGRLASYENADEMVREHLERLGLGRAMFDACSGYDRAKMRRLASLIGPSAEMADQLAKFKSYLRITTDSDGNEHHRDWVTDCLVYEVAHGDVENKTLRRDAPLIGSPVVEALAEEIARNLASDKRDHEQALITVTRILARHVPAPESTEKPWTVEVAFSTGDLRKFANEIRDVYGGVAQACDLAANRIEADAELLSTLRAKAGALLARLTFLSGASIPMIRPFDWSREADALREELAKTGDTK